MISPIKTKSNTQDGVSLLLAVLVLASITAISFSLATIVFIEIRSSSDFVRSERALYSAYAITEEALFKYSRVIDFEYLNGAGTLNGVELVAEDQLESLSPLVDVVPASSIKQYDLVDAENPNGAGGYKRIKLVYFSQLVDIIGYKLWSIDPAGTDGPVLVSQGELNGYGETFEDQNLDINFQYQLDVENNSGTDITINLYTYGPTVDESKGLPNIGQTYVDITASYLGLTRKYQAKIPVQY
jgi:hypothetical protein